MNTQQILNLLLIAVWTAIFLTAVYAFATGHIQHLITMLIAAILIIVLFNDSHFGESLKNYIRRIRKLRN